MQMQRTSIFLRNLGPFVGLGLVFAIFGILNYLHGTADDFLNWSNFRLLVTHASIVAAAGLGMTIIMIAGGIDLSVGYVISLVTVIMMMTFRWVINDLAGSETMAGLAALAAGLLTGVVCGTFNGVVITQWKIVPFVATLAMLGIARGVGIYFTEGSRLSFPTGTGPLPWMTALRSIDPMADWTFFSPSVWSVFILGCIVAAVLRYTVLGRHCFAIGSSEPTARLCGVRVERTKIMIYALAGLLTGWAGVLQFCRSGAGSHDVGAGMELSVIAAVVIGGGSLNGGEGTILGTILGAIIISVLDNGCSRLNLQPDVRYVIIAAIILGVAALNSWRSTKR